MAYVCRDYTWKFSKDILKKNISLSLLAKHSAVTIRIKSRRRTQSLILIRNPVIRNTYYYQLSTINTNKSPTSIILTTFLKFKEFKVKLDSGF